MTASTANDVEQQQLTPPQGHLLPLRTKAEIDAHDETIEIYVCGVPVKETGKVLDALKKIPNQTSINLQHLRRVAKADYQPQPLRALLAQAQAAHQAQQSRTCLPILEHGPLIEVKINAPTKPRREVLIQAAQAFQDQNPRRRRRRKSSTPSGQCTPRPPVLVYIFLCATSLITRDDLHALLVQHVPYFSVTHPATSLPPSIYGLEAPRHPPASSQQAAALSTTLWPVTYNPNTSYGPNPAIVAKAQQELQEGGHADKYMGLAREAAAESRRRGIGESIGVVIVERRIGEDGTNMSKVVAVAGDARWCCTEASSIHERKRRTSNPGAHAVLRAVDFVAQKRRTMAATVIANSTADSNAVLPTSYEDALSAELDSTSLAGSHEPIGVHLLPAPLETAQAFAKDPDITANYEAQKYHSPLLPLEEYYLSDITNPDSLSPNGYLCLNLEAYITHEPCVMCSMALVHSRIGRVVFEVSHINGALRAEEISKDVDGVAAADKVKSTARGDDEHGKLISPRRYGLFWREDLNWRFFAWRWQADDDDDDNDRNEQPDDIHSIEKRKTHLGLPLNVQV